MSEISFANYLTSKKSGKRTFFYMVIIFRLLMDYMYENVVATTYGYMGFEYNPNTSTYLVSWILLLIGTGMVRKTYLNEKKSASFEVILLLFIMSYIPFTSMVGFGALESSFVICNTAYWFFLFLFTVTLNKQKYIIRKQTGFTRTFFGDVQLKALAVLFGVIVLYISGRYTHFRFNFNLLNVYELRAEASENALPLWLSYVFSWSRTLNSVLLAYFLRRKKLAWVAACCVIQLLSFGYDGSKTTLFLLALALGINLLPSFDMASANKWLMRGLIIMAIGCALIFAVTGNFIPISILIRRVFYLPVRIAKDYFTFFTTHQPDFFRQSFLRYFGLMSPYDKPIPYMIGDLYFNSPDMSANNGLIADAITNLGYAGILVFPLLLAFIFRMLEKSARGLDPRIYITVGIYLSVTMTNSFLFTILLTHGLLVTILVLYNMKRDENSVNLLADLL